MPAGICLKKGFCKQLWLIIRFLLKHAKYKKIQRKNQPVSKLKIKIQNRWNKMQHNANCSTIVKKRAVVRCVYSQIGNDS